MPNKALQISASQDTINFQFFDAKGMPSHGVLIMAKDGEFICSKEKAESFIKSLSKHLGRTT